MRMVLRVLTGFLIACIAAALTKVAFAHNVGELGTIPAVRPLLIATHVAIFASPFALVAIAIGEWQRIRDWVYYALSGIAISLAGLAAQYSSESSTPLATILNSHAAKAFLTAGFIGGVMYWLFSGRHAGSHPVPVLGSANSPLRTTDAPARPPPKRGSLKAALDEADAEVSGQPPKTVTADMANPARKDDPSRIH